MESRPGDGQRQDSLFPSNESIAGTGASNAVPTNNDRKGGHTPPANVSPTARIPQTPVTAAWVRGARRPSRSTSSRVAFDRLNV